MRALVTGGAGFIGANLVRLLLEQGAQVVVLDDLSTGDEDNLTGLQVELVVGSILDNDCLMKAVQGSDAIVHLAARPSVSRSLANPGASHEVNATGTLRVLEAARSLGNPFVITASSSSVYGSNPVLPKHEGLATRPISPYAVSKLAAESYTLAYQACFGLESLAFRFFNVYGPYQAADHAYAAVIPRFVAAALADEPLPVEGTGEQSRDFTYVGTVVKAIVMALTRRTSTPEPVNLAFGTRTSLLELVSAIEDVIGRKVQLAFGPPRPGDVPHSQADTSKLSRLLPDLVPVDFMRGLRTTIEWYRSNQPS